jgi:hypothetical protein
MASFKELFKNVFSKKEPVAVESFTDGQSWMAALAAGTVGGFASKFVTDIYRERVLYPHDEMQTAQKAYRYNSYINSSVRTRANFMLGGEIAVRSEDSGTEKWLNEMINETGLSRYPQFMGIDTTNAGNWYAERIRSGQKIVYYEYISHPERMYINIDDKGLVKDYFQEVPERWSGTHFKSIKYYGDRRKAIKGIPLPKDKVFHLKLGVAEIPVYGRGPVCCLTNDVEILLAVERSMAVIAHYKGIPKKLIQLKREGQDAVGAMKAAEAYANMISNLADEENPVLPEEIKVDDLSYGGKDMNFEPFLQYLKKKITVALAPSFIVHGEETNYAVSRDQKEAWIKEIEAERSMLGLQIHKELLLIAQSHGKRVKDFEVIFGKFDLGQTEEKIEYASKAFSSNLITLNEAREIMGYQEDKELGDSYSNELTANSQLGGGGEGDDSDFSEPSEQEGDEEGFSDEQPTVKIFESLKESLPDGAVRLAPGQTPPAGSKTVTGPKGGKYYLPSGKKGDKKVAPSSSISDKAKPREYDTKGMSQLAQTLMAEIPAGERKQIDDAVRAWRSGKDTFSKNTDQNGVFTKERFDKVHKPIMKKYIKHMDVAKEGESKIVFMAGLPASGKTFATKGIFKKASDDGLLLEDADGHKYVVLNADDLKNELPEYEGTNAAEVHEESSQLNKQLVELAKEMDVSIVIDGVLSNEKKATKQLNAFKKAKYKSSLIYVDVPGEQSITQAHERYKRSNRFVDPTIIMDATEGVNRTISSLNSQVDSFKQIDNTMPDFK